MDIITYILSKKYTDTKVAPIASGMIYMGSVANRAALDTVTKTKGHVYTTLDTGHEWVCDGTTWVDLSADLANKQDKLTAGDNITINTDNKISATNTKYTVTLDI